MSNPSSTPGHVHYNAIVLTRILIDNPGHTFTRNLDAKFASAVKDLLRQGQDMDVQQFLRETMDWMETQRSWDEDLATMLQMWKKEKDRYLKVHKSLVRILVCFGCLVANVVVICRAPDRDHRCEVSARTFMDRQVVLVSLPMWDRRPRCLRRRNCLRASLRLRTRPICWFSSCSPRRPRRFSTTNSCGSSRNGARTPRVPCRLISMRRTRHPMRTPC